LSINETNTEEICVGTKIIDMCGKILSAVSDLPEIRALKLESYWILTNLSFGTFD